MKWTRRAILTLPAAASMYSLAAFAQKPPAPAPPSLHACKLPFFDLLGHTHKPDLRQYGIEPIRIYAAQHLWGKGEDRERPPRAGSVARTFSTEDDANTTPVVLDIEHWPMRGDGAQATVSRMLDLLQMVRSQAPRAPIGYYGVPPIRDYWRAIRPRGSSEHTEWQRENDRFQPVAEACDLLFPSLYTFYDDVPGWRSYAAANLEEARRLGGSRKVYAFIWPQYHGSNKVLGNRFLPDSYWQTELEEVSSRADGGVLWGGWGTDGKRLVWDDSASWWNVTRRYLMNRNQNPTCT